MTPGVRVVPDAAAFLVVVQGEEVMQLARFVTQVHRVLTVRDVGHGSLQGSVCRCERNSRAGPPGRTARA
jgi:hypothetical protein